MHTNAFDFDTLIDRRNTGSIKWDKYAGQDVIPMWVADMDFRSPPAVMQALHERVDHGVFGYTPKPPAALVDTVLSRLASEYHWQIEPDWLVWLPGLVCGLNVVSRAIGEAGCDILTAVPVYQHLFDAAPNVGKQAVCAPLARDGARWTFDFDALEQAITPNTRLFMLCNPHNPVGRMWNREELLALAEFCERHDLVICSDEIHCQLVLDSSKQHLPIASLDPAIAKRSITLMAPSKTYNLPGLGCAFAIIPDPQLRAQIMAAKQGIVPHVNALGYTATLAAFRDSDDWLAALLDYLRGNYQLLLDTHLPGLSISPIEATYLAWIEVHDPALGNPMTLFEQAGVGLSPGDQFLGTGFVRLNFGCPRSRLQEALSRIRQAVLQHGSSGS